MLRISARQHDSTTVLELQGRLAGPWVAELARVWSERSPGGPQDTVVVDLADVTYVDEQGQDLLIALCRAGATLTGAGCLTTSMLADITRRAQVEPARSSTPAAAQASPHTARRRLS